MDTLETYLRDLRVIRSSGQAVDETSYYGPLALLLNEVGKTLKPKVTCVINIKNRGAGIPDGGLFTADQLQKTPLDEVFQGQLPARGCIEVKGTGEKVDTVIKSKQVKKYLDKYRQVLVTNYRDFALVGIDESGNPVKLEAYSLTPTEPEFWTTGPHKIAETHNVRFNEYLKRVMLHAAPLVSPEDVAWFLASYARDAKARIEGVDLPALNTVRAALEEALGLKFEGEEGEHFFRSTLIQTLFYGIFSAWVLWSRHNPPTDRTAKFNWHEAAWSLHVPMIRALYEQIATPGKLKPLGLVEVLDWTSTALNRVDRAAFFSRFEEGHAVQYFYEPFLEAFDPELRKDLGVWYTPTEIVKYMVARVDTVLREELDLPDGLADPNVFVLDPSCGTGTYLVEVLRRISATLKEKGEDALIAHDLKRAAMERVFGFEILPAPFVVAHLQLGLLLQNLGSPLSEEKEERVGVYLTNALTGWEPASEEAKARLQQIAFSFAELKEEHDAAERVKRETPILVILGNPPYNAFAGTSRIEEQGLVEPYKEGLISEWGIKKFNLDDLYVRFFRLAERRIAEKTGKGIVCYISNHSWVSDPSFVVLRQHLLSSFDRFWVENMHGNRQMSERAPDGKTSETIFAVRGFSVGIKQGVVISLWVKNNKGSGHPLVLYRDDLNAAKAVDRRAQLLASLEKHNFDSQYRIAHPRKSNRLSLRPSDASEDYLTWPTLEELCADPPFRALIEARRGMLVDMDRTALETRMRMYYDPSVDWNALGSVDPRLITDAARFDAKKARKKVLAAEAFDPENLRRYLVRPFDINYCYVSTIRPLWNEPRPALLEQSWPSNSFIVTRLKTEKEAKGSPVYFSSCLVDYQAIARNVSVIPLRLKHSPSVPSNDKPLHLFDSNQDPIHSEKGLSSTKDITANLSQLTREYLNSLGITDPDADEETAATIWMHVLAIGYSPAYLTENADGIRWNWPRIPLPSNKEALLHSAKLGREIAGLVNTESTMNGVTSGTIRQELRSIGPVSRDGGGALQPELGDLQVTAGWGHFGGNGVMPGKGKFIERPYTPEERDSIIKGTQSVGLTSEEAFTHLGETTFDIYLNDKAYWRNIPARVWDYYLGGYPVMKKWLSFREHQLLGRPLIVDEAREVTNMARRIAAILLLEPTLDLNYQKVIASTFTWPKSD